MFLALFCAAIVCVPLLIVSFLYDAIPYDLGRVQRDLQSAYSLRYASGSAGASNRVTITTADHRRYVVWCLRAENVRRIRDWCGRCGCPSFFSISPSFLFGKKSRQTKANCRKDIPQRLGLANVLHKTDGSHTNRPFFRAVQAVRGGSALLPLPGSAFCFFFREKKSSLKQAAPHPLFRMRRAALCFVFYLPMLR